MAKKGKDKTRPTNGWDFATTVANGIFDLAKSNNLWILTIFCLAVYTGLPMLKLEGADLLDFGSQYLLTIFGTKGFLIGGWISTVFGYNYFYRQMKSTLQDEIKRVTNDRKEFIHSGPNPEDMKVIEKHRSTKDSSDIVETHIVEAPTENIDDS